MEACAAVITWRNALLKQAIALKEEARDLIVQWDLWWLGAGGSAGRAAFRIAALVRSAG